jgi:hypothetical protein
MPHHGFGTYNLSNAKHKFNFEINVAASLETGVKWRLAENGKWFLYTGLFVDYGLLDVRKGRDYNLYQYNPQAPSQYIEHSIFKSKYNNGTQSYVDKVNTFSAGIKFQLTFNKKSKKK